MIMNTTFQLDMAADDGIEAKREIIRQSLNEIAVDVTNGLREAALRYPVYLFVPGSGDAVVSMMTPDDPSDSDWDRIGDIVREVLSEYLGGMGLRSVEMSCAMVNGTMGATEMAVD
jgi:hypothetical protein